MNIRILMDHLEDDDHHSPVEIGYKTKSAIAVYVILFLLSDN